MVRSNPAREMSRLLAIVAAVATIAALYLGKIVFLPLALAMLFTFLLAPLVTLLERMHLPRVLAIVLVLAAFGGGLGTVGWIVGGQLIQVTEHLPHYRSNISLKMAAYHRTRETSFSRAQREVEDLGKQLGLSDHVGSSSSPRRYGPKQLGASPERPVAVQEVGQSKTPIESLHGILGLLAAVLMITVFTFFMLLQREDLRNRLILLTGQGHLNLMTQAMNEAGNRVSRYFSLQLLVNLCYGSVIFTALHFIGLPHAMLWGALASLLRFIPYIGAPIAALLPTLLSLAVFRGWTHTLIVMALFFVVEVSTANFIEPHIYGKHTGLSSLAILVAAVFWTLIWGPIGLILSVPLTVCLVVIGAHMPHLEFLTVLLGDQPVMPPEAHFYQRLLASDAHEAAEVLEDYLKEKPLEELYDSVLLPALSLSEQDRHSNALDDATVSFVNQTTKELVEEVGLRGEATPVAAEGGAQPQQGAAAATNVVGVPPISPVTALCVPVRDEADETVAIMLAQLLERAGHHAEALSIGRLDEMLSEIAKAKPDLVYLSGLPPYAISHARNIYRKLRAQEPEMKIIIGLWNYSGDPVKAAREISGGEQNQIRTTLAQALGLPTPPTAPAPAASADVPDLAAVGD